MIEDQAAVRFAIAQITDWRDALAADPRARVACSHFASEIAALDALLVPSQPAASAPVAEEALSEAERIAAPTVVSIARRSWFARLLRRAA